MQTPSPQVITWPVVALEALKYLGPAALVLIGSLLTMRHQRKTKRDELMSASTLRARELVFNHYQKKLDRLSTISENLGKSFGELQTLLESPETGDAGPAVSGFIKSLIAVATMAKHDAEGAADELRAYGLEKKYEHELNQVQQVIDMNWLETDDVQQKLEYLRNRLFSLTLVQEAVLEARMKDLFSEYLPAKSTLKLNS